jgi:hypothetical protein
MAAWCAPSRKHCCRRSGCRSNRLGGGFGGRFCGGRGHQPEHRRRPAEHVGRFLRQRQYVQVKARRLSQLAQDKGGDAVKRAKVFQPALALINRYGILLFEEQDQLHGLQGVYEPLGVDILAIPKGVIWRKGFEILRYGGLDLIFGHLIPPLGAIVGMLSRGYRIAERR